MPEGPEEQLEFLRREDIRTMAKDMARLREEEAKKERERIIQLQAVPTGRQEKKKGPAEPAVPEPPKVTLMPSAPEGIKEELPGPPSKVKKIFIRVVIVLLLLFIAVNAIALAYSFWRRSSAESPRQEQLQPPLPTVPEEEAQKQEPQLPFPVTKTSFVFSLEELSQLIIQEQEQGITRIVFGSGTRDAAELLSSLGITAPQEVLSELDSVSLFFLHVLGEKKRLGLIFAIRNNEAAAREALLGWEPKMEENTASFFSLMGNPGQGRVSFFKSTEQNKVTVRFQTLSLSDFGIVYTISKNFLILTSSLENMEVVLDALELEQERM